MKTVPEKRLLVSSGDGPAECRLAVSHVLKRIEKEAGDAGLAFGLVLPDNEDKHGPPSAIVTLRGKACETLGNRWTGTIQWICPSPIRRYHKRRNWFVGVFALPEDAALKTDIRDADLKFETFRAGGPGGQHQNTTDSGVRVKHVPTGIVAVSRNQRSQHRNKQEAIKRLAERLLLLQANRGARASRSNTLLHHALERGNPVLRFSGERFVEK